MGVQISVQFTVQLNSLCRLSTCAFIFFASVKTGGKSTVNFYVKIVITYELYRCTELNLYICTVCTSPDAARKRIASEVTRRALKCPSPFDSPTYSQSNEYPVIPSTRTVSLQSV